MHQRRCDRSSLSILALVLLWGLPLEAQETSGKIVCPLEISKIRLAIPESSLDKSFSSADRTFIREIEDTLRNDLSDGGLFIVYGPKELSVLKLTGLREHDFEQYRMLGSEVVLLSSIKREGDEPVLEFRAYDLASQQVLYEKQFASSHSEARPLGQKLAAAFHIELGYTETSFTNSPSRSDRYAQTKNVFSRIQQL